MSGTEHRSLSDVYGALRERAKSCDKKELLLQGLFLSRKYGTYVAGSFHLRENVARSEKRKECCKVSPFVARSSFPLGCPKAERPRPLTAAPLAPNPTPPPTSPPRRGAVSAQRAVDRGA